MPGHGLNIGHRSERSEIYGPGVRAVIWVQGCTLACPGCWNKEFWPARGGETVHVKELLDWLSSIDDIEGITLLGGEPLQQPEAVLTLLQGARELGLSIFLYSGYEREELNSVQLQCLELADIAVLGRYEEKERDLGLRWRGSANQIVEFLTSRYSTEDWMEEMQEIEIKIEEDGSISAYGYPDEEIHRDILGIL
jgi:anaerobic ribonucleoside-triphosphate reductase activating protein